MRLTRLFFADIVLSSGLVLPLSPDQAHYATRVLRLVQGDSLVAVNATSGAWQGLLQVTGKHAALQLEKQIQAPSPVPDLWLLLPPVKKEAWDFCIEKATELGIAALQPVVTAYTQSQRLNEDRVKANMVEAAQQSERTGVPALLPMEKLDALLRNWDTSRRLFVASERSHAKPFAAILNDMSPSEKNALLIGPEGGFSPEEKTLFSSYDFIVPVSLGPRILRTDTAVVAALSVFQSHHGDWR